MRPNLCGPRLLVASLPRSFVGAVGDVERVRAAQSRGLWPGESITFLLDRFDGACVLIDGASDGCMFVLARTLCCGIRRLLAADGGGARLLLKPDDLEKPPCAWPGRGSGAREAVAGFKRGGLRPRDGGREEGGGMAARSRDCAAALFRFGAEDGRGGGGIS